MRECHLLYTCRLKRRTGGGGAVDQGERTRTASSTRPCTQTVQSYYHYFYVEEYIKKLRKN